MRRITTPQSLSCLLEARACTCGMSTASATLTRCRATARSIRCARIGAQFTKGTLTLVAASQGHAHPRIVAALTNQAQKLGLVSRAFTNDQFAPYAEHITSLFGYQKARRTE